MDLENARRYGLALEEVGANMAGTVVSGVVSSMLMGQGMTPAEIGDTFREFAEHVAELAMSPEMARMVSAGDQVTQRSVDDLGLRPLMDEIRRKEDENGLES